METATSNKVRVLKSVGRNIEFIVEGVIYYPIT